MSFNQKEDVVGKWSVEKLNLLHKYLAAYVKVLASQSWCRGYEYVDAFAGSGKPITGDEQQYIEGSPLVALRLMPSFTKYHFIEQAGWRVKKLEQLVKDFADRDIAIYEGDCNKILREEIIPKLPYSSKKRAIAFIDPFGMEFEWDTMKEIASTKTVEIFLNFPVMAINREVLRKNPALIDETAKSRLNRFWGTEDWVFDMYKEENTLFGPELIKKQLSGKEFGLVFKKRLKEIFPHCTDPILMTNSKRAPLYCLLFAGHNPTGKKIASDIFLKHEKEKK